MSNDRVPEIENDHLDLDRLDHHSNYNCPLALIEIAEVGIVTETTDEVEAVFADTISSEAS